MTTEERKRVVEITVDEVRGRIPIVAHIGSIGTHVSIELAQHAQTVGVDGISSLPPFFYGFSNFSQHCELLSLMYLKNHNIKLKLNENQLTSC